MEERDVSSQPGVEDGAAQTQGQYVDLDGERHYVIRNVDELPAFFVSLVSSDDHWLFASSNGALSAGRGSPETALFPYQPVDRIHDSPLHTGCKTLLLIHADGRDQAWEPFNPEQRDRYLLTRSLYKNALGNKVCFEEVNHELGMVFRYRWLTSARYGFIRECELANVSSQDRKIRILDGVQNLLPANTPRSAQTNASNLVDAYKWSELDEASGLAAFTLYSAISDRAEPAESLEATTAFTLGLNSPQILLSAEQIRAFRRGAEVETETRKRGVRCAYLVAATEEVPAGAAVSWRLVTDIQQTQQQVVSLRRALQDPDALGQAIFRDIAQGSDQLERIVASADGLQLAAEEHVSVHHYANVLFNVLRGGVFHDQHRVSTRDVAETVQHFNRHVHDRHLSWLSQLPPTMTIDALLSAVSASGDLQLLRLAREYLPITFGRRHGDPSRPWNQFEIRLRDEQGRPRLSYAGNWRDVFQNWEALALSFPQFIESMIAKFVNASTMDGYNPYRIMKEGIDWEVEDPDDPWSYIGYWGDHQIIYLQKLLELSSRFHPTRLPELLRRPLFCYANVPYRIKSFDDLAMDPKDTVFFDDTAARLIEQRVAELGADGKLVPGSDGKVYQVNLLEKLLVPLLAKLANLVAGGGIWLNTQRPEWNDANNALVGHGLSMVTLCYMRRYVAFLDDLLASEHDPFVLSLEVQQWLVDTADALEWLRKQWSGADNADAVRYQALLLLGQAASRYRSAIYEQGGFTGQVEQPVERIRGMLADAQFIIDESIAVNWREDGLFNAYNLLDRAEGAVRVETLYPMLEGQVAVLSSGGIAPAQAIDVVDALFSSPIYRPDQDSFMLYPDRELPSFLEKNRIPAEQVRKIPLIDAMLAARDERIVLRDEDGCYRFCADFRNAKDLHAALDGVAKEYDQVAESRELLSALYEQVFRHKAFTGRSGTMFGFEGLGCIYWHMVAKLLLALQENFFSALDQGDRAGARQLARQYYRIRGGLGFNKTPSEYGAFPADPYSHTPGHAGAQQPGMTGQVKEEIITRFGELGVRVDQGVARFEPALLKSGEFSATVQTFRYLDISGQWQEIELPEQALAFTWCQVPVIYQLDEQQGSTLTVTDEDGRRQALAGTALSRGGSAELFQRSGAISRLHLSVPRRVLLA